MVYDKKHQKIILFGGKVWDYLGDTQEWDGDSWSVRSTTGPAARSAHGMIYDSLRGVVVLFGGAHIGSTPALEALGDTWEWHGQSWELRSQSGPAPRWGSSFAFDTHRGVAVLFGGFGGTGEIYQDTWEWDGNVWILRSASGGPSRRSHAAMSFDAQRNVCVLHGGANATAFFGDTWEWDGEVWERVTLDGPGTRMSHTLAFDEARGKSVLFGGVNSNISERNDTWEWDGALWTKIEVAGPTPRFSHAMTFDPIQRAMLIFGGQVIDSAQGTVTFLGDTVQLPSFCDQDQDGFDDDEDACVLSDLQSTLFVRDCDSGVKNWLFNDGCTMADRVIECGPEAQDGRSFDRCVRQLTRDWQQEGVISIQDRRAILRCLRQNERGKRISDSLRKGRDQRLSIVK